MADLNRPNYGSAWATTGEKVAPDAGKFSLGWVQEMMPYQYENYLQARQDEAILYLLQKGIPEYSSTQEYTANKSMVLYNGVVYLATQTVTNVLPTVAASWKRVSTISDNSGIVSVAGGGTGATTQAQARTNLGLGTAATLDAANIVQKDINGDFTANVITASLAGNASTADKWKTARTIQLNGAATSSSANIDGSSNVVVSVTSLDASTLTGTVPSTSLVNAVIKTSATGVAKLPKGSTSERPASPEFADFRGNTTTSLLEYFNGTSWVNPQAYSSEYVLNRANHTGEQDIATISDLPIVLPALVKDAPSMPCIIKTSATTLAIKAGTHVKIGNAYVSFSAQTAITMPALTAGEDYSVWVKPDGSAVALADPYFSPAAAPVPGALKIGGFHNGLVAPGTTPASGGFATTGFTSQGGNYPWTQSKVDRIAGINEFSIWDLAHRSKGEQRGFTFDPQQKVWVAIYLCNPDHITNGISRYNTPAASGTVLPIIPLEYGGDGVMTYGRLSAYEALEILASHGCRLITQEEFASGALGVTEGQSVGGAASTIPATKREPGYTSRIGLEQATGHIWVFGGPLTSMGGSAPNAGPSRGTFYGGAGLPLFGGNRADAASSGSRASNWGSVFLDSNWYFGLRAACDHYQGGI